MNNIKTPINKISETAVVVSCHNHNDFIRDCIYSIANQTYKDFDILFWDNNSTDGSDSELGFILFDEALIYKLSGKVSNIRLKMVTGIDKVLPVGIARWIMVQDAIKKGYKYIAIMDADDYWHPTKLEKQIALFKSDPEIKLVYSDCYYLHWKLDWKQIPNYPAWIKDKDFSVVLPETFHQKHKPFNDNVFWNLLTKYNFMPCPTLVFEAKALDEVIGNPMHYTAAEDYDWILKMADKYKVGCINEPLAYYRIHTEQITQKTRARCTAEEIDVVKRACKFRTLTRNQGMVVYIHLLWLYMKLLIKEFIEAEDYIRELE